MFGKPGKNLSATGRDADRQVYGVQGGRQGHVEAVMGAADEEMALHAGVLV